MTTRAGTFLAALAAVASAAPGCREPLEPLGEIVLHVDTNAYLPPAEGASVPDEREPPLVDRVRFDVFLAGEPVRDASREFPIDEALFREAGVSISLLPPPGRDDVTVRVRLYRADRAPNGEPRPGVMMETTVRLPAVGVEGQRHVTVHLDVEDFGRPVGTPAPVDPEEGTRPSRVGTWPRGRRVGCLERPADGTACIRGGAFFFGDPAFVGRTRSNDITDERLVVVSPFYLDLTEVTVRAFNEEWPSLAARGVAPPGTFGGTCGAGGAPTVCTRTGASIDDWCTWSAPGTRPDGAKVEGRLLEALPLNCVSWETARAFCLARGADLPSEVQFEFVMSGAGEELDYLWGKREPDCFATVWGRAGAGALEALPGDCRLDALGWMEFPGGGRLDRITTDLGTAIVDLAGNLAEWARDRWSRPDEAFWASPLPATDPVADLVSPADGDARVFRGGSWLGSPLSARAGFRLRGAPTDRPRGTGFRCARAARAED